MFEMTKERTRQLMASRALLDSLSKQRVVEIPWEYRVALIDGVLAMGNQITSNMTILYEHGEDL